MSEQQSQESKHDEYEATKLDEAEDKQAEYLEVEHEGAYVGDYGDYDMSAMEHPHEGMEDTTAQTDEYAESSILVTAQEHEHGLLDGNDDATQGAVEYYAHEDMSKAMSVDMEEAHLHQEPGYGEPDETMYASHVDYSLLSEDTNGGNGAGGSLTALSQAIAVGSSNDKQHVESEDTMADAVDDTGDTAVDHLRSLQSLQPLRPATEQSPRAPGKRASSSADRHNNARLKSRVWEWYEILTDGTRRCRFCAQRYGRLTATTILARHYHTRHDVNPEMSMNTPNSRKRRINTTNGGGGGGGGSHLDISRAAAVAAAAVAAAVAGTPESQGSNDAMAHMFADRQQQQQQEHQECNNGNDVDIVQDHQTQYDENGQPIIVQDSLTPMISRLSHVQTSRRVLAAVGQFCAQASLARNLEQCQKLIATAAQRGARMIFLPEASDFIPESRAQSGEQAQPLDGFFLQGIQQAAKTNDIWVSLGVHERQPEGAGLPFNTNAVVSAEGALVAAYRKLHLFDVSLKDGPRLNESSQTAPGDRLAEPVDTPMGRLGLAVCYDLRFPEMAQRLRLRGAQMLCYPSAFTEQTGAAHWELLLRARAVETQTYVFAAAQVGKHNPKRSSFGDAMIVDPWGSVVARCSRNSTEPTVAVAEVDLDFLAKVRREIPVFGHKRTDIFGEYGVE